MRSYRKEERIGTKLNQVIYNDERNNIPFWRSQEK